MNPGTAERLLSLAKDAIGDAVFLNKESSVRSSNREVPVWVIDRLIEIRDIAQKEVDNFLAEELYFENKSKDDVPF